MKQEGHQVKRRGYYILSADRRNFANTGLSEPCHGMDHRMILEVLRGGGGDGPGDGAGG